MTTSDFIPDYTKYTKVQLFEVYRRIDRNNHPERLKAIEKEIKNRMDLSEEADLSEKLDVNELDGIYKNYFEKEKKKEQVKKDSRYTYLILIYSLIVSFLLFYGAFIEKDWGRNPLFLKAVVVIYIVWYTINLILILAKEKIKVKRFEIKKNENPGLYYFYIFVSFVLIILLFLALN